MTALDTTVLFPAFDALSDTGPIPVVSPTAVEMLEQFVGVDKQGIIAPPARFVTQRLGKVTFSDPGRAT